MGKLQSVLAYEQFNHISLRINEKEIPGVRFRRVLLARLPEKT
jgi:hypothetical protein